MTIVAEGGIISVLSVPETRALLAFIRPHKDELPNILDVWYGQLLKLHI